MSMPPHGGVRRFRPKILSETERAKLLNGLVVPRPIAVVSSISPAGHLNLAPFSYFNVVGEEPMTLSVSITNLKPDGSEKDTLRNARLPEEGGVGEFVVNIASASYAAAISRAGASLPHGESEFDHAGLAAVPSDVVRPPRVAEAPAWFECRTAQIVPVGRSRLIIGEVVAIGVRASLLDERLRVDVGALDALARLAGAAYCRIGERFDLGVVPG